MAATMASLLVKPTTMAVSKPPLITHLLLPLKWRNPLPQSINMINTTTTTTTGFIKCSSRGSNFSLQCLMNSSSSKNCCFKVEEEEEERKQNHKKNPFERFAEVMFKSLKALLPTVIMAVLLGDLLGWTALLFRVLHSYDPTTAALRTAIILGVMLLYDLYRLSSALSPDSRRRNGGHIEISYLVIAPFLLLFGFGSVSLFGLGSVSLVQQKTTVLKLQVALLGTTRSLQRDLDGLRTAGTADMSFTKVLQETTSVLLRHSDYCISGYSSVDVKQSKEDGQKHFNKLSIEERGKSDAEKLASKGQSTTSNIKIILITMLVTADGVHELPAINDCADLKEALQKLGSISSSKTMAVEVLWTPRNENDTLTVQEFLEAYPLLRPL